MQAARVALSKARTLLLDPLGKNPSFSDDRLLPFFSVAYDTLRNEAVTTREIAVDETVVELPNVRGDIQDLSDYLKTGGRLQDLIEPITIWERPAGSTPEDYTVVDRTDALPNRSSEDRFREYEWRGGNIYLIGATQNLDLKVRYDQIWPAISGADQPMGAQDVGNILGYWTAGLVGGAMGNQQWGAALVAEARHQLYLWSARQVKDVQEVPHHPRPFSEQWPRLGNWV